MDENEKLSFVNEENKIIHFNKDNSDLNIYIDLDGEIIEQVKSFWM